MKFNLIIDGNYQLMKTIFPLHNSNTLYGELEANLNFSFDRQIALYPFNQVFFVSDGKSSWRKAINADYKANRSKKEGIDWDFVFQCYTEFKEKISKRCTKLESDGLEGDDWIAAIVRASNAKGISCLILSTDRDYHQLLKWNIDPNYINILYRDNLLQEKVWLPQGYSVFMNHLQKTPVDLFALDWRQDFFALMRKFGKYQMSEINPIESLFCKIVQGDKTDNISSLYSTTTKDGKIRGIGEAGALKIWKNYIQNADDHHVDYENLELRELIIDLVIEYKKAENNKAIRAKIFDNLQKNIKMIRLEERYMPVEYQRILKENVEQSVKL